MTSSLDVIGDVHGQFDKLVGLLSYMGYRESGGSWRHPERSAIFVGDLIDRGPKQLATVDLVRGMVNAGTARCVMGNHEFNAIAWATPDPEHPGKFLRDHHKPGNREQHAAFLDVVEGTHLQKEITDWFKTLPLWLDLGEIRVVHACWHQASMDRLQPLMGPNQTLTDKLILLGSRKGNWAYQAIETICKGPEVELPEGFAFKDKEGKVRTEVRVRWWQEDLSTYRKACHMDMATDAVREASRSHASDSPVPGEGRKPEQPGQTKNIPPGDMQMIPDLPMPAEWVGHPYSGPPVLFGHYWFMGKPQVISSRFACLDYSAARDGPLVAYRWDGEMELVSEKLAWV